MKEINYKEWFYNLTPTERNKLSLKYRGTYAYGIFKYEVFEEIYNYEKTQ